MSNSDNGWLGLSLSLSLNQLWIAFVNDESLYVFFIDLLGNGQSCALYYIVWDLANTGYCLLHNYYHAHNNMHVLILGSARTEDIVLLTSVIKWSSPLYQDTNALCSVTLPTHFANID